MGPESLTILFKGIGMLIALGGGFAIARYGFHLYKDGAGLGRDKAGFELGSVRVNAHSVGSVVMSTAFLWAWAGVALSPNLERTGNDVRIYSFSAEGIDATIPAFSMLVSAETSEDVLDNEEFLVSVFATSLEQNEVIERISINGQMPEYAPGSARIVAEDGGVRLAARLSQESQLALVEFSPLYENGVLTFTPSQVQRTGD